MLALRVALDRYQAGRSAQALDVAFAAAAGAVAEVRGERAGATPSVSEIASLLSLIHI